MPIRSIATTLAFLFVLTFASAIHASTQVDWQPWSSKAFKQAELENKLILLDMDAVWCHWCHVMDEKTYGDPNVIAIIEKYYVPVRVDQDNNPELSRRYENYGWPATVILNAQGTELIKRRGYIPAQLMGWLLQGIYDNPEPDSDQIVDEVTPASLAHLTQAQHKLLTTTYENIYDPENGGWGNGYKFNHRNTLEFALLQSDNPLHRNMARQTLHASLSLLDPVWGGVYQYSDEVDWQSPHFEKIVKFQADNMALYSNAFQQFGQEKYLKAAQSIYSYLTTFLKSESGAFYTSQDADLNSQVDGHDYFILDNEGRRAKGLPTIDKHIYPRENGWLISSLSKLFAATGEQQYLATAVTAANWINSNRTNDSGAYLHDKDQSRLFLGDSLAMGQAMLDLYRVTGNRQWLEQAESAAEFIDANFKSVEFGGYTVASKDSTLDILNSPTLHMDSNIDLVRFANQLYHNTGAEQYKTMAQHGMTYLASEQIARARGLRAGILLADYELSNDPVHIAIVGKKDDTRSQALFATAIGHPANYLRIDWWDRSEGPLPNSDITYPELNQPAAFVCANNACSLPIYEADQIRSAVDRLNAQPGA